jgi:hypothetical protein
MRLILTVSLLCSMVGCGPRSVKPVPTPDILTTTGSALVKWRHDSAAGGYLPADSLHLPGARDVACKLPRIFVAAERTVYMLDTMFRILDSLVVGQPCIGSIVPEESVLCVVLPGSLLVVDRELRPVGGLRLERPPPDSSGSPRNYKARRRNYVARWQRADFFAHQGRIYGLTPMAGIAVDVSCPTMPRGLCGLMGFESTAPTYLCRHWYEPGLEWWGVIEESHSCLTSDMYRSIVFIDTTGYQLPHRAEVDDLKASFPEGWPESQVTVTAPEIVHRFRNGMPDPARFEDNLILVPAPTPPVWAFVFARPPGRDTARLCVARVTTTTDTVLVTDHHDAGFSAFRSDWGRDFLRAVMSPLPSYSYAWLRPRTKIRTWAGRYVGALAAGELQVFRVDGDTLVRLPEAVLRSGPVREWKSTWSPYASYVLEGEPAYWEALDFAFYGDQ